MPLERLPGTALLGQLLTEHIFFAFWGIHSSLPEKGPGDCQAPGLSGG